MARLVRRLQVCLRRDAVCSQKKKSHHSGFVVLNILCYFSQIILKEIKWCPSSPDLRVLALPARMIVAPLSWHEHRALRARCLSTPSGREEFHSSSQPSAEMRHFCPVGGYETLSCLPEAVPLCAIKRPASRDRWTFVASAGRLFTSLVLFPAELLVIVTSTRGCFRSVFWVVNPGCEGVSVREVFLAAPQFVLSDRKPFSSVYVWRLSSCLNSAALSQV